MIGKRREWAKKNKLNADLIEKIYMMLVNYFINNEIKEWEKSNDGKN